jgi:hypothetical protein
MSSTAAFIALQGLLGTPMAVASQGFLGQSVLSQAGGVDRRRRPQAAWSQAPAAWVEPRRPVDDDELTLLLIGAL